MKKISSQSFKLLFIVVIIFSNYSFGKEFQKLFEITTPMNQVSNVDMAINSSFDILIYRLTGLNNLSTIKQIAPSVKAKKEFLISYEPISINDEPYLVSRFNKDSLLQKLNLLNIPIIGYNRPIIMMLVKIEDGNNSPYILNTSSNSILDIQIKNILEDISTTRGVFFELPVFDLNDLKELNNLTIFDSEKEVILPNYEFDFQINLNVAQSYINKWSITGDLSSQESLSFKSTLDNLRQNLNNLTNNFLLSFQIPDTQNSIKFIVDGINSYENLVNIQEAMSRLMSIKSVKINSYIDNSISYTLQINGDVESFMKQIEANPSIQLVEVNQNIISALLNY